MQREAYLKQVQGQKEIVMHYIKDHKNCLLRNCGERDRRYTAGVSTVDRTGEYEFTKEGQNRIRTGISVISGKRNLYFKV